MNKLITVLLIERMTLWHCFLICIDSLVVSWRELFSCFERITWMAVFLWTPSAQLPVTLNLYLNVLNVNWRQQRLCVTLSLWQWNLCLCKTDVTIVHLLWHFIYLTQTINALCQQHSRCFTNRIQYLLECTDYWKDFKGLKHCTGKGLK